MIQVMGQPVDVPIGCPTCNPRNTRTTTSMWHAFDFSAGPVFIRRSLIGDVPSLSALRIDQFVPNYKEHLYIHIQ